MNWKNLFDSRKTFCTCSVGLAAILVVFLAAPTEASGIFEGHKRQGTTLVAIGKEDQSSGEFKQSGFRDVDLFVWQHDNPPSSAEFPFAHFASGTVSDRGVQEVLIEFVLTADCEHLLLRVCREGSETTVVRLDQRAEQLITAAMLGSRDGNHFGGYDLDFGLVAVGPHQIRLTVGELGGGTGGYAWDSIQLIAR